MVPTSRWSVHGWERGVLRLRLDTGVRVSELCGLGLTDIDLDRALAYVTGKASRPRVVPFGAGTAQALDRGQDRVQVFASTEVARQGPPVLQVADAVLDADPLRRMGLARIFHGHDHLGCRRGSDPA